MLPIQPGVDHNGSFRLISLKDGHGDYFPVTSNQIKMCE